MLFRSATSVAVLACAASAAAKPQPYKLAVMAVPGLSLSRRDTLGYQPDVTECGDGNTCAEACGAGYDQCKSEDNLVHCFNPEAGQSCCNDDTGNSCEAGYYCTHDTKLETWCCPDSMDLEECAAAYNVKGGLEKPEPKTTEAEVKVEAVSTSTPTSTPSSTPIVTETKTTPVTTTVCETSSSHWTSPNATVTTGHETSTPVVPLPPVETTGDAGEPAPEPEPTQPTGAASASGVSLAFLVAAAGFVALF